MFVRARSGRFLMHHRTHARMHLVAATARQSRTGYVVLRTITDSRQPWLLRSRTLRAHAENRSETGPGRARSGTDRILRRVSTHANMHMHWPCIVVPERTQTVRESIRSPVRVFVLNMRKQIRTPVTRHAWHSQNARRRQSSVSFGRDTCNRWTHLMVLSL
jgi:hypothetical protein